MQNRLKVLIACEESQRVCKEFRLLNHEAYSCDILEPSGGRPEWHILGDCLKILGGGNFQTMDGETHFVEKWDLLIAHPPCTYLSNAGATRLYHGKDIVTFQNTNYRLMNEERVKKGIIARDFFLALYNANVDRVAVENPTPSKLWQLPEYSQAIQPYEYGHPYTKRTCLWLKGLKKLRPTNIVEPTTVWVSVNTKREKPGENFRDPKIRSKTFSGIAKAMAKQWSDYILNERGD